MTISKVKKVRFNSGSQDKREALKFRAFKGVEAEAFILNKENGQYLHKKTDLKIFPQMLCYILII